MTRLATIAVGIGGALVGCVEHRDGVAGAQSLEVVLTQVGGVAPADPGEPGRRLDPSIRDVEVVVSAFGPDGEIDTGFDFEVGVRTQSLGVVSPPIVDQNIPQIRLTAGVSAPTMITLPSNVYGPTAIWIEDGGDGGTYATGTSPTLWYRDPFLSDLQRPADETSLAALLASPLEDRQVGVGASRYGADGRLIITSIYAQGYTVSDVQCGAGGVPPCTAGDYDHIVVFTFNRPRDENGCDLVEGQFIDGFAGAVSEFIGLTEIGFPQTFVAATATSCDARVVDTTALPAPANVDASGADSWFAVGPGGEIAGIQFERNEGGLVAVAAAALDPGFPIACPLDDEYETYNQWELDVGLGCGSPISAITSGTVSSWIPEDHVGAVLTRVVGALRPVNFDTGGSVWIIFPRSSDDLVP